MWRAAAFLAACCVVVAAEGQWHMREENLGSYPHEGHFTGWKVAMDFDDAGAVMGLASSIGVAAFNVSDVHRPTVMASISLTSLTAGIQTAFPAAGTARVTGVKSADGYWYVFLRDGRLCTLVILRLLPSPGRIQNTHAFEAVGSLVLDPALNFTAPSAFAVVDGHVYVVDDRLLAIDATRPAAPSVASVSHTLYDAPVRGLGFARRGRHLFVVGETTAQDAYLSSWDLRPSPGRPVRVASVQVGARYDGGGALAVHEGYVYVADGRGVHVFDVRAPGRLVSVHTPTRMGLRTDGTRGVGQGIVVTDDFVYVVMKLSWRGAGVTLGLQQLVMYERRRDERGSPAPLLIGMKPVAMVPQRYIAGYSKGHFFEALSSKKEPQVRIVKRWADKEAPSPSPRPPPPAPPTPPTGPPPETTPAPAATGCGGACVQWLSAAAASLLILASLVLLWHVGRRAVLRRKRRLRQASSVALMSSAPASSSEWPGVLSLGTDSRFISVDGSARDTLLNPTPASA